MKDTDVKKLSVEEFFTGIENIENSQYDLDYTHTFKKGVRERFKSNLDLNLLLNVVTSLAQNGKLDKEYFPHNLKGFPKSKNIMECHILPDWLLVWEQKENGLTLLLLDTGTHSKLFNSKQLRK